MIISCPGRRGGDTGTEHSGAREREAELKLTPKFVKLGATLRQKTQAAARRVSLALDMPREGQLSEDAESIAWYLVFGSEAQERNLG